jgi:hypothetical protein
MGNQPSRPILRTHFQNFHSIVRIMWESTRFSYRVLCANIHNETRPKCIKKSALTHYNACSGLIGNHLNTLPKMLRLTRVTPCQYPLSRNSTTEAVEGVTTYVLFKVSVALMTQLGRRFAFRRPKPAGYCYKYSSTIVLWCQVVSRVSMTLILSMK